MSLAVFRSRAGDVERNGDPLRQPMLAGLVLPEQIDARTHAW